MEFETLSIEPGARWRLSGAAAIADVTARGTTMTQFGAEVIVDSAVGLTGDYLQEGGSLLEVELFADPTQSAFPNEEVPIRREPGMPILSIENVIVPPCDEGRRKRARRPHQTVY